MYSDNGKIVTMFKRPKSGIFFSLFLAVNVVVLLVNGVLLYKNYAGPTDAAAMQYPLLSKRIFSENQSDILINFISLRQAMRNYAEPLGDSFGVYFEYLPSGVSIGVNDRKGVNIASLLKVPLVMAVYKQYEKGTLQKDQRLTIRNEDINTQYGTLWKRGVGATLSVQEAVTAALKDSDNTASNVLLHALPNGSLNEVADYLDIPQEKEGKFIVISPKNYSSVLRSLHLSAFLARDSSNEILTLLTKTQFTDQLQAGVPKDVPVAHKVGEYTVEGTTTPTVSDCGIVYVPNRPYILCIMTSESRDVAAHHMSEVSKLVYDYVVSAKH